MFPDITVPEYRRYAALRVEALNHALRGIPAEQVRLHVCWGVTTARTGTTSRCGTSWTSCCRSRRAATRSRRPTPGTNTSGPSGRT